MPTYEYLCQDCDQPLEVFQSFTDDALTECPSCQGTLKKVFGSVGVVFKGSGFYRTDSRDAKSSAALPAASKADGKKADTPASAPAPAAAASSTPAATPAAP